MGCLDGNCSGTICKPELISPAFPPKGGWKLEGWPDFTPLSLREKYRGEVVWEGNSPTQVLNPLIKLHYDNGYQIDTVEQTELCQWANEQWCTRDPGRCPSMRNADLNLAAKRKEGYVSESMQWASPFWKMWNVAVSDIGRPEEQVGPIMQNFVCIGVHIIDGTFGCPKCYQHFQSLLAEYPVEKVATWRQARVWLWRVHNESRDSGIVVPYYDIAKINGWEELEDAEVLRIIEEELRA